MKACLLFVLFSLLIACRPPAGQPWLEDAIREARATKKPLVVEFYATWCKPCQHFETHILTDARVKAALTDVRFVRYDIDLRSGRDAFARCRGQSVPTVVGIDRDGRVRLMKAGTEQTAEEFLNFLRQAKQVLGAGASGA